ncbi:MAG: D-aminoacylase [Castellaniella sp.]
MAQTFNLIIRNATIIDGSGAERRQGDVAIADDRIARIGDLGSAQARQEVDAEGRVLAPGFIDAHTHDDRLLLSHGDMSPKVSQGVTTIVGGNCGISLAPMPRRIPDPVTPPLDLLDESGGWFRFSRFGDYLDAVRETPPATNCAMLVGHTSLRVATMDSLDRPATTREVAAMRSLVEEAMQAGAIGVSTGLAYENAFSAPTEEVIAVCAPLSEYRGLYCTHMRNEGDTIDDALHETFRIGRALNVPVVISHHKLMGKRNHGRSKETLALIREHMQDQSICLDCYPYTAASTVLTPDMVEAARRTTISWSKGLPQYAGRDFAEVVRELGGSQEEAFRRLLPAGAIYHSMDEDDVEAILAFEPTMIGSDGLPHDVKPHPRLWGTFPRVLGHYSRDQGLFSLETAVHKMTGLSAQNFGLAERGLIREGYFADLTLFDPDTVADVTSFEDSVQASAGIEFVMVNGRMVWQDGRATGERPGRVLGREAA